MKTRLQNYTPTIDVVPARKRGTPFSPDEPAVLKSLCMQIFFMGPGSPTYAVRQLQGSLAWDIVRARHRLGATLAFASAATVSIGAWAIPVYEIYKVGEDVHSKAGLNFFSDFGMHLSFVHTGTIQTGVRMWTPAAVSSGWNALTCWWQQPAGEKYNGGTR